MTRPVSATLRTALQAQETGEAALVLLTVDHADLPAPLRFTSDAVATTSGGESFAPLPFDIVLPADGGERAPRARLRLDNVDRNLSLALAEITGDPPTVQVEIVRASNPDFVELDWPEMELLVGGEDAQAIEGELGFDDMSQQPFPQQRFVRALFRGMP